MKLYNTLTKTIEEFTPQSSAAATIYTCGPTVYDYPHIGNWFTFVRYDILVRTLRANAQPVKWVMNITDVGHLVSDGDEGEDKLEKGARRENKTAWDVAQYYTNYFLEGLQRLNITTPDILPKATDHIADQIALVRELEKKGFTYVISDGVYFDTSKFPKYKDFAGLDVDEQQAGARVEYNREKHNPTDFALWKFSPKDQKRDMEWDSPWGKGFPGWHIECSAMSMKYLGETLDIHSGGIDHIPVHHTNEIAQSEAVTGKPFARYWMHTNHISIEGSKISKSLGNSITLEDIEAKGFTPEDLRINILESHYRSQSRFSWDSLAAAHNRLTDLYALAALRYQTKPVLHDHSTFTYSDVVDELIRITSNDLHTEAALMYLSEVTKLTLVILVSDVDKKEFETMLQKIDELLGTQLTTLADIDSAARQLIADRELARATQDWGASDRLRQELADKGIGVRDTSLGAIWYPLRPL